jgi:NAD(P)H-hydrate epimerase
MENAGRAAAMILQRLRPHGRVVGVVGSGNNGGDALVLLRTLRAWGRDVLAIVVADRPLREPLLHGWDVPVRTDEGLDEDGWRTLFGESGAVVDGVLGTGLRAAPRERQRIAIEHINDSRRWVLSIDVPSGIDSGKGAVPGSAVQATVTVAFGAPKLGSLLHPARALVGRLIAVEIAFPPWDPGEATARVVTPAWAQARLPTRDPDTHKNAVGRVLIVAGQRGMAGSAVLAARAALSSGAGLVRLCSAPENREIIQSAVPEAVYVDATDPGALQAAMDQCDAIGLGPGLGTETFGQELAGAVARGPLRPLVVDADALNLASQGKLVLPTLAATRPMLATPHAGEMARLLGTDTASVQADRIAALASVVEANGHALLLKGSPSLVGAPGARVHVDCQGSSDLAAAGIGDALTGVCVTLMAQGLGATEAGAVGLYLTGRSANLAGRGVALTPSDVIRCLPDALGERSEGVSDLDLPFVLYDADAGG